MKKDSLMHGIDQLTPLIVQSLRETTKLLRLIEDLDGFSESIVEDLFDTKEDDKRIALQPSPPLFTHLTWNGLSLDNAKCLIFAVAS